MTTLLSPPALEESFSTEWMFQAWAKTPREESWSGAAAEQIPGTDAAYRNASIESGDAFRRQAGAQADALEGALGDIGRLLSNRDLDQVRNRITQGTLGTVSVSASSDEHLAGGDLILDLARGYTHFNSAAAQVAGSFLMGGAPGGAAAIPKTTAQAWAALKSMGGETLNAIQSAAGTARRSAAEIVESVRKAIAGRGGVQGGGRAIAVDTNAYIYSFPDRATAELRWTKVAREILAGRDIRVPEAMIEELALGSGLTRAQVLKDLASLGSRSSAIPDAPNAIREAIARVAKASVRKKPFDTRIGASAAELGELFATGDQDLARALFRSGLMKREQIVSLTPPGVIPGRGWDSSMLSILIALGLGGGAAAVTPDHK